MCSTYSKLFALQRPVVKHMLTSVTFPFFFFSILICSVYGCWRASAFLSMTACIWEPVWEQKTHIKGNEYICQLHISFWHINAYHGVRSSVAEYWAPVCFLCTAHWEVQWLWCNNKANPLSLEQLQCFITHNMDTVVLPGLSKQLCRLLTPGEFDVAPQSMEIRTLWKLAFVLIRIITHWLVCFFCWSLSSMDTCPQAREYSFA